MKDKMENGLSCPICNNFMKVETYVECVGIAEETHKCSYCGYFYNFAYGNYMEIVNRREFIWTYKCYENEKEFKKFNNLIQKHKKIHRRKWNMFKTNYLLKEPFFTYFCNSKEGEKIERIRGGV